MLLWLTACTQPSTPDKTPPTPASPPAWDAPAATVDCDPDAPAALFDAALADADLAREDLGFTQMGWNNYWGAWADNPFVLSWFLDTQHAPTSVPCFTHQLTADLDAAASTPHPVASLLTAYAPRADVPFSLDPVDPTDLTLDDAVAALLEVTGDDADTSALADLDPDLADALVPIVLAITDAVSVRYALDDAIDGYGWGASKVYNNGAGMVAYGGGRTFPDTSDVDEVTAFEEWYLGATGPRSLVDPARRIAFAVEDADLGRFVGGQSSLRIDTSAGALLISPASDDEHTDDEGALLLHLELGGDDVYTGSAGANQSDENPVSVLVDLGGDDTYGYVVVPDDNDTAGALPSDEDGRFNYGGYYPSYSKISRQGSGRYGIGLLYDMGGGTDTYASLRMSQGFGAMGVGVLADDGGDDTYTAEAAVQGSAVFGIGLLYDGGGDDHYTTWAYGQGFGYVGSGGLLYDSSGSDVYWSDPGRDFGGTTLYYSPQLADGQGNSSFTQGAAFGLRDDTNGQYFAGGIGTLRDKDGADTYTAGVFAEGTGYMEGTGILSDGGGDDTYDAIWYIQGGAAHIALGILLDAGGNDAYNPNFTPYNVMLGSGHDGSVGIAIDEAGDDTYHYTTLAEGASNCQGIGVFVDNDGADTYQADSAYSTGLGNHSSECDTRTRVDSVGIFLDAGADADTYVWPAGDTRTPANDTSFGVSWNGTADEHGGAVDGDGETAFHAY